MTRLPSYSDCLAKNEIDSAQDTYTRPQEIQSQGLFHVEMNEPNEHDHCYDFLDDLQLGQAQCAVSNAVGGYLEAIFKEGNAPTHENGYPDGLLTQITEVTVPGKGHEYV
jgi:hypothetical protein